MVVTVRCDRMFSLSAKKVHTNGDDVDDVDNGNAVTKEMVLLKCKYLYQIIFMPVLKRACQIHLT